MNKIDLKGKIYAGILCTAVAGTIGAATYLIYNEFHLKPAAKETEARGFVAPSNIELIARDVDFEPGDETVIRYKNKHYIMKLGENKVPRLELYEIK